ncbi:MAG TPA: GH25 family lysozyme [Bryobacteraceae bacterium]|jgi:lysozyme|nr:GH25 family lysozyme [Bryobacteraceae bacterium]
MSLPGIDISRYQQKIDWGAVTASGVQFCFIKATEGARDVDVAFQRHWEAAGTARLIRGAYHFFRPQIPVSAQADLLTSTIGELQPGDLPPALDLEGTAGWTGIPPASRASLALKMLEAMESSLRVTPIVYMSPWFATEMLNSTAALARFPIWIAQYTEAQSPNVPKPWKAWTFWQHSQGGKVPGISGLLDLDRFQGSLEDLKRLTLPSEQPTELHEGNNSPPVGVT